MEDHLLASTAGIAADVHGTPSLVVDTHIAASTESWAVEQMQPRANQRRLNSCSETSLLLDALRFQWWCPHHSESETWADGGLVGT